eukprot:Gb_08870 [translate_table: standard]
MDRNLYEAVLSENIERLKEIRKRNALDQVTLQKNTALHLGNTALHEAAQIGQLDVVKVLLAHQPDLINIRNVFQETPLFKAAEGGHLETVLEILEHSDPLQYVTEKTLDHRTCLHVAVVGGHLDVVRVLLDRAGNQAIQLLDRAGDQAIQLAAAADKYGNTALHLAVCGDHLHIVNRLLELDPLWCYSLNENGESPLHIAVKLGFLRIVKVLIENKTDSIEAGSKDELINQRDYKDQQPEEENNARGQTLATANNIQRKEKTLSDNKWCEKGGDTPLHIAARNKNAQIVEALVKKTYCEMQSQEHNRLLLNMDSTLYKAARSGNIDSLNGVLGGNPAALDQVTPEKNTALHLAASAYENDQKKRRIGKIKFVQYLLQLNPKLSLIQNDKGNTALHEAAQVGLSDVVKVFLTRQPDLINIGNVFQDTPLFKAAEGARGNTEYYESYRIPEMLVNFPSKKKPFLYSTPDVTEAKHKNFSNFVQSAFKQRTNSELVVAGLLATVSFTAAFTIPGGFSQNGTPLLISRLSFKVFLVLDIMAFFLSLFVALMWQLNSPISTGDMMCFMTGTSLLVCVSFACIANSFVAAVHVVLSSEEVKTLAWSVLGICLFICFCGEVGFVYATAKFLVKQARIRRLLGLEYKDDKFVEYVWTRLEKCGFLDTLRKWERRVCCWVQN